MKHSLCVVFTTTHKLLCFYRQIEIVNHKVDGGPSRKIVNHKVDGGPSRKIVNHKAVWGAMLLHGLHDPHAASAQDPR